MCSGAVLHSHSICCNLITSVFKDSSEFRISEQEMIKGISGHGYFDELVIPIIENTAWEHELADTLGDAIRKYPKTYAVLVRRHGMYVWGDTWEQAKRHAECIHYLFEIALNSIKLGLSSNPAAQLSTLKYSHYLCDIEGTTTPISFVKDQLFPFAANNVKNFLLSNWDSFATKCDVAALQEQAVHDRAVQHDPTLDGVIDNTQEKNVLINNLSEYVKDCIAKDRKIGALKQLQGHIWEAAYESGEIKGALFDDVPKFFEAVGKSKSKLSIYSSGSRHAQRLLFEHSSFGDLRPHINCYFDTQVGNKREVTSYHDIALSLGVHPREILFLTDVLEEAEAAHAAGFDAMLVVRPGNGALRAGHEFKTISSFQELLR